jgi:hypothetical protein
LPRFFFSLEILEFDDWRRLIYRTKPGPVLTATDGFN